MGNHRLIGNRPDTPDPLLYSKMRVLRLLEEWVEETYPDMYMATSVELSADEVREMSKKIAGIQFGIYVKVGTKKVGIGNNPTLCQTPTHERRNDTTVIEANPSRSVGKPHGKSNN